MKKGKTMWKRISVAVAVFLLCCMSVLAVLAEEDEVIVTEDWMELRLNLPKDDMAVRLYTFTIRNEEGEEAGKVELRYGRETGSSWGILLWITTENGTEQIDSDGFRVSGRLRIAKEVWKKYFKEEFYTCERSEELLKTTNPIEKIEFVGKGGLKVTWNLEEVKENQVFDFRMYKDGEFVGNTQIDPGKKKEDTVYWVDSINESGSYTIVAKATGTDKRTGDSEEIFTPEPYHYERPDTKIGEVHEIRWSIGEGETIPTVIEWDPVEGTEKYKIYLGVVYQNGRSYYIRGLIWKNTKETNKPIRVDWINDIKFTALRTWAEREDVRIVAEVRPLSSDIEKIANGGSTREEEYRPYAEKIQEIKESLANTTAERVLEDVKGVGVDKVAAAMQRDDALLKQMEELEKELIEKNEIKVEPPVIDAATGIDSEKVEIVGTALNAVSGGAVTVKFEEVSKEEEKEVDEVLYNNGVQISIALSGDTHTEIENRGELLAPITITMMPPEKVDLSKLVILHYHADEEPERIYPVFREDGRITFSVTRFSTFVFAEMVSYTENTAKPEQPSEPSEPSKPTEPSKPSSEPEDDNDSDSEYVSVSDQGVQSYGTVKRFVKADGSTAKSEWVAKDGKWYYAQADGSLKTGWYQNKAGIWYYLQENCEMATNWQLVNGKWYYLDSTNGDMKVNWLQTADGKWYYLNPGSGDMAEGWKLVNGKWYYLNPVSGEMATGWKQIQGKWYYLTKNGDCLINGRTPEGYQVDKNGVWIP